MKTLTPSAIIKNAQLAMAELDDHITFLTFKRFFIDGDASLLPLEAVEVGLTARECGCELQSRLDALNPDYSPYPFKRLSTRELREWFGTPDEEIELSRMEAMNSDFNLLLSRFLSRMGHPDTDHRREILCCGEGWLYHFLGRIEAYTAEKIALHRAIEARKATGEVYDSSCDHLTISGIVIEMRGMEAALDDEF